jgi:hypothetical protein
MKKTLKTTFYAVFDDEENEEEDTSPFPTRDEMIAYLERVVILDWNSEDYGDCDGAPLVYIGIHWDESVMEEDTPRRD